jgi:hypothetical protein
MSDEPELEFHTIADADPNWHINLHPGEDCFAGCPAWHSETVLVQVWRTDLSRPDEPARWMDYARGTWDGARRHIAQNRDGGWRAVHWIDKQLVLIEPMQ